MLKAQKQQSYQQSRTPLKKARNLLKQARTLLRRTSDKSKIDILKTILIDFFADSGAEYVT